MINTRYELHEFSRGKPTGIKKVGFLDFRHAFAYRRREHLGKQWHIIGFSDGRGYDYDTSTTIN